MPTTLQWTPALAVGIPEIDSQHQELFLRAGRLITALREGEAAEVLPLLRYLEEYVIEHFEAEEQLMRKLEYPAIGEHTAAHEAFRADFRSRVRDVQRTGPTALAALTVHNWLSDWLRQHIGKVDQELGRFVASRGR